MIVTILSWLIFGFLAGLLARAIYPGRQPMTFLQTAAVGIAGSFVGGFVAHLIYGGSLTRFHTSGFIGSVVGALVVIFLLSAVRRGGGARARR